MNGLGKVFILIFLLYQVQQGELAILPNMGLIIVLRNTSRDGGRIIAKYPISFLEISLDSPDGKPSWLL